LRVGMRLLTTRESPLHRGGSATSLMAIERATGMLEPSTFELTGTRCTCHPDNSTKATIPVDGWVLQAIIRSKSPAMPAPA